MKKTLAILLAVLMLCALCACGDKAEAPAAEETAGGDVTVTFSTGETFTATAGEDFVFFFQCDSPGDMGAPADGEEGAGITVSDGTVAYSDVFTGGPFSYPTAEKVTVSGFTGDFTVTVTDAATNMGATYTIHTEADAIADAIAFCEQMAAEQAANPMGDASGEASSEADASGEPSGEGANESKELVVELDGKTYNVTVSFEELSDTAKSFTVTGDREATGTLEKGVWTADKADDQAFIEATQAAFQGYAGAGASTGA